MGWKRKEIRQVDEMNDWREERKKRVMADKRDKSAPMETDEVTELEKN